jgi:2,3-bisphosphoglycerate-independent phosphoglycerate mutase
MSEFTIPDDLIDPSGGGRIVLVVMDGVGGLPGPDGKTELEAARTPNLDGLAAKASLGMMDPVAPGVTPGSGPGHLALFGYDPVTFRIGRGTLSALGVGFDLRRGDVAFRLNLATLDGAGNIVDRRAGRPSDEEGQRIVDKVRAALKPPSGIECVLLPVKEHRAVMILRGRGLSGEIEDTDPQETGVPPLQPTAVDPSAERTAAVVSSLLDQAQAALVGEERVHTLLARGFSLYERLPSITERFGLRGVAIAKYPMYRGVARLVGMTIDGVPADDEETVAMLEEKFGDYDFHFLHFKATDARGEDGDFQAKVAAIEAIDALFPRIEACTPDVLIVTGDHSTPASYAAHSWHPVPVLLASQWTRPHATGFGESSCRGGDLGHFPGRDLMAHALAHAGRLEKFGA